MSKYTLLLLCLAATSTVFAKKVTVIYSPSDAELYVDGNLFTTNSPANINFKGDFVVLELKKGGYVTSDMRFYKSDKRKTISFELREDDRLRASSQAELANKDFTITVSEKFINHAGGNIELGQELAWKMLHQVIYNYFDEISTSDKLSGFIQTPWVYTDFPVAKIQVRTRLTVKESNIGGQLTYKVRISSQTARLNASRDDQSFKDAPDNLILKKYENIISDFQSRLSN